MLHKVQGSGDDKRARGEGRCGIRVSDIINSVISAIRAADTPFLHILMIERGCTYIEWGPGLHLLNPRSVNRALKLVFIVSLESMFDFTYLPS